MMMITFECNNCGWTWMGNFAYCPYCKGSTVRIIEYETIEDWIERIAMIKELQMLESYFIVEEYEIE